tara:strand:- start:314 stop:2431 length:2118 start_codon:yes stop_codon:yes gene_type:complete
MKISKNQVRLIKYNGNYTKNDVVSIVVELLNQQGLTWWLDFGQLLSLHRDNKPLDWVDDWDFCIIKKDNKTFNNILNLIRPLSTNHFIKDNKIIRFNLLGVEFDFYFCQYNEKDKNMKHLNFEEGGYDIPSFFYDRLDNINWNQCSFNVPRHLDYYLLLQYGENWKTPIKKFMGNVKEGIGSLYKKDRYNCLIAGVFDGLHYGHQNLISHGLKYFNEVVIGVHSDESINYKTSPTHNMLDRVKAISDRYPHIKIIENCPLKTDAEYLKTMGCDFVVFGDEPSDNMKLFYPDNEVNHPIDRYPILSSSLINQQTVHSYCINLHDKEHKFTNILNELGRLSIYPNRFVVEKQNLTKRILREGVNEKYNQILESHLKLLKHLESIDQPYFIIFEDDIKVIRDIDINEIISSAPKDWDVIYLGGMNHHHTPKIIDNQFYKCKFSFNAHALIVKKEFVPKMIEYLEKREYENDVIFAYMQSNSVGNWYGLIEDAIIQDGVDSPTLITTYKKNVKVINLNNVKVIKPYNKIFQIGFNKCGTTSLHQMFIESGLKSVHWDGGKIAKKIDSNIKQSKSPLNGVNEYDCYIDIENLGTNSFPFIKYYDILDRAYPNSLFILNTRPLSNWAQSRLNHQRGGYANMFKKVLGVKTDEELITIWTEQWTEHHNKVVDYFKNRDNFITFDIETEGDKLVDFLRGWSIPVAKFPHTHKS